MNQKWKLSLLILLNLFIIIDYIYFFNIFQLVDWSTDKFQKIFLFNIVDCLLVLYIHSVNLSLRQIEIGDISSLPINKNDLSSCINIRFSSFSKLSFLDSNLLQKIIRILPLTYSEHFYNKISSSYWINIFLLFSKIWGI